MEGLARHLAGTGIFVIAAGSAGWLARRIAGYEGVQAQDCQAIISVQIRARRDSLCSRSLGLASLALKIFAQSLGHQREQTIKPFVHVAGIRTRPFPSVLITSPSALIISVISLCYDKYARRIGVIHRTLTHGIDGP